MPHVFKPPNWGHVFLAFVAGAREARANSDAEDVDFCRAADAYTKQVHEEHDPETERRLRQNDWSGCMDTEPTTRLNELDKTEMHDLFRVFRPEASDADFEEAWTRFVALKAARLTDPLSLN